MLGYASSSVPPGEENLSKRQSLHLACPPHPTRPLRPCEGGAGRASPGRHDKYGMPYPALVSSEALTPVFCSIPRQHETDDVPGPPRPLTQIIAFRKSKGKGSYFVIMGTAFFRSLTLPLSYVS